MKLHCLHAKKFSIFLIFLLFVTTLSFESSPAQAAEQNNYRWRNNDGSEAAATWVAAENAPIVAEKDIIKRLRLGATNTGSESEFSIKTVASMETGEARVMAPVIDPAAGFAYFGVYASPASKIIKIRLSDMTRVGAITLESGDGYTSSSVIDPVAGFAYFGTNTSPSKIIKIRLSDFTRVGAITLESGEDILTTAAIDPAGGFAYFGTNTSPSKIIKIRLSDFTRVGAITLESGDGNVRSAVIDPAAGFAYFGSVASPAAKIVKIRLSDFARVGAITLESGEDTITASAIDPAGGYAYFGIYASPSKIVKIRLSDFTRVGAITLESGENNLYSAVIDPAGGYVYFGVYAYPAARIVKIRLSDFTRVGNLNIMVNGNDDDNVMMNAFIDPANGNAYFVINWTSPTTIVKVRLSDFTEIDSFVTDINNMGDNLTFTSGVIDTANGFAYIGTLGTHPAKIVKVRLSDMTRIGAITLEPGENHLSGAAIDTVAGFAYFGTTSVPGKIIKIRLSDFTRVGVINLNSGEGNTRTAVIDPAGGFLYFGSGYPAKVIKIRLSDFTRVADIPLGSDINELRSAVIDIPNGYAYFGSTNSPAKIVKIRLADFSLVGTLTLESGENLLRGAGVIDTANGYAYFGTDTYPGKIIKIRLSDFTRSSVLTLNANEGGFYHAAIDTNNGYAYFVSISSWSIFKIRLSDFTRTVLSTGTSMPTLALIDSNTGFLYIGDYGQPIKITKISIAPRYKFRLEYGIKGVSCANIASWTPVPSLATTEHWQMADSSFFDDGAATTNSAGIADGNIVFKPGQMKDLNGETSEIALGEREFTELEYSVKATANAVAGDSYCFRLTNAGSPASFSYGNYAEAVLPVAINGGALVSSVVNPNSSITYTATGLSGVTYVITLPSGATPLPPNTDVAIELNDTNPNKPSIKISAVLPTGTTKSVELARGAGSYACVDDIPGGSFAIGPGCPLSQRVTIPAPGQTVTYAPGKTISTNALNTRITLTGLLNTVIAAGSDYDGDGLDDELDACPEIVGAVAWQGCPAAVKIIFQRHTVQTGTQPGSTKTAVVGAIVNTYDKAIGSCAANIGFNPHNYETILNSCAAANSSPTDANGEALIGLLPGDYLSISRDPVTNVVAGVSSDGLLADQLQDKFIQVIVRPDNSSVPAKTTKRTGSLLYIIEPEYVEWSNTQEYYPYVFESEGDWGIEVTVSPPEGFVADYNSLSTNVNSDYKALQFTLTDIGSCWECGTDVEFTIHHKGNIEKIRSHASTAMTEEFIAQKGLKAKDLAAKGVKVIKSKISN